MVKEEVIEEEVKKLLEDFERAKEIFEVISKNISWKKLSEMANVVAVGRWKYNDHGPVHAKIVTRNSVKMARILRKKGIKMSFEIERKGSFEDSLVILILSSMFHDVGNCITRDYHEIFSMILARDIIRDILEDFYPTEKVLELEPYILEGIVGHMGNFRPTSLEGRIVAVADGLDMEEGRARIPYKLGNPDIHKLSALSIQKVFIEEGEEKPIRVNVLMKEWAGVFQIEQVLIPKIKSSRFEDYIELNAKVKGEVIRYL